MNHHTDETLLGWFKIVMAWIMVWIASLNFTAILTAIALCLTIIFTALQIYKIWHDIKRQKKIDAFAHTLRDDHDRPGNL